MKLRELINSFEKQKLQFKPKVSKDTLPIFVVSSNSSVLEKELIESIARARVSRSPLHQDLNNYLLNEVDSLEPTG